MKQHNLEANSADFHIFKRNNAMKAKRRMSCIWTLTFGALFMAATPGSAAMLVNGDFSSAFDDDGPDVVDLQANTGEWLSDVSSVTDWVVNSGAADLGGEGGLGRTRSLAQAVQDSKATKGGATIDFLIEIDGLGGNANEDLNLYVLGWNSGDTSPTVDLSQGDGAVGTSVVLNDAINLFDGTATLSPFQIVENGAITVAAAAEGIDLTAGFDVVSLDIDFGAAGYDYFAVVFEGEPRNSGLSSYLIDDVSILLSSTPSAPEPSTVLLTLLGLVGLMASRRRRKR